jgi:cytochrome c oxidase subunit 2
MKLTRFFRFAFLLSLVGLSGSAFADDAPTGMARPWQLGLQKPVTPVMEHLYNLHTDLTYLIVVITIFVMILLGYVCVRFSARNNPVPSKLTHNTLVEIIWTGLPILILVFIAIPSLRIHYYMAQVHDAQMTLKVTGYQWYWGYQYPDQDNVGIESRIYPNEQVMPQRTVEQDEADLKGEPRLLTVDNPVVVPVDTTIRVLITAQDVIHSWSVPAFGVKLDAIPGRVNETWFKATQLGTFRGQCSQLCGVWHGFMPIVVKVVSKEDFAAWIAAKKKTAANDNAGPVLAQAK